MTDLRSWVARRRPNRAALVGRTVMLEPLDVDRHAAGLWAAHVGTDVDATFRHLPYGPFDTDAEYAAHLARQASDPNDIFFALVTPNGPEGVASLMRVDAAHGVAEVGHICLSPGIQRTAAATEMIALIGTLLFDELGYRRFEWKCDNTNVPSKAAAERFGFRFEGVFRNHMVVKGRNRDTAWFAMTDADWPDRRAAFAAWLAPENFDGEGHQRSSLARAPAAIA